MARPNPLQVVLCLVGFLAIAGAARTPAMAQDGWEGTPPARVSLQRLPDGTLALLVNYPWAVHADASIEVQLAVPPNPSLSGAARRAVQLAAEAKTTNEGSRGSEEEPSAAAKNGGTPAREVVGAPGSSPNHPLFFKQNVMHGEMQQWVFDAAQSSEQIATTHELTVDGASYTILGQRNEVHRPAATIVRVYLDPLKGDRTLAAYPTLADWSLSSRFLLFNLPPKYFAARGTLHISFLSGNRVFWQDTLDWPGIAKPRAEQ